MVGARGGEPVRAGAQRVAQLGAHRLEVVGGGLLGEGPLPHHVRAKRRMPNVCRIVQRLRQPIDGVEILGERRPAPVDTGRHRGTRDVLGPLEVADDQMPLLERGRGEREAAVAHDDGGHPVPARGRAERIPEHLRVHVRVAVDEAGRDDVAGRRRSPRGLLR